MPRQELGELGRPALEPGVHGPSATISGTVQRYSWVDDSVTSESVTIVLTGSGGTMTSRQSFTYTDDHLHRRPRHQAIDPLDGDLQERRRRVGVVRHDEGMADMDWSTPEGLEAIREHLAARIDGYAPPEVFAVGITPASSSAEIEFPHLNVDSGGLPAVVLATIIGHTSGSQTYDLSATELATAIQALEPVEAYTAVDHPNLAAWRELHAEVSANPARSIVAVFIADLDDPVGSDADATLRGLLAGHTPVT